MESHRALINSIAKERIGILFKLAENAAPKDRKLAGSYIKILNSIRTHYKIALPNSIKARLCRGCSSVLIPGLNCKVTLVSSKGYLIYKCASCGAEKHLHYKKT